MKFQEVYLNIINETWNRFCFNDLIMATALVTDNFKENWVSAKGPGEPTGKKVLAKMNSSATKTYGAEFIHGSSMSDSVENDWIGGDTSSPNYYNGSTSWDEKCIIDFWKVKADKGDDFASKIYRSILSHTNYDNPKPVLASEVGLLAFAIWKACNARVTRQENNVKSLTDQGIDLNTDFPFGKKLENLQLTFTGVKVEYKPGYGYYGKGSYSEIIYGRDESTGIKYKIKAGTKDTVSSQLIKMFDEKSLGLPIPKGSNAIKLTVSGKVKGTYPEYKMVSLNYGLISSPSREELESLQNSMQENIKAEKAAKKAEALANAKSISEKIGIIGTTVSDQNLEDVNTILQQQYDKIEINPSSISDQDPIYYRAENNEIKSIPYKILKTLALEPDENKLNQSLETLKTLKYYDLLDIISVIRGQ